MNKNIIKILILLFVFIVVGVIVYFILDDGTTSDEIKFKEEYESLNGLKNDQGKRYVKVELSKDNNIKYASFKDVMEFLEAGTGILYLGFPECPWCRNMVSLLTGVAKDEEIEDIYYFNALSIRDIKELIIMEIL